MKVNGVDITRVARMVWHHDDDREIRLATIIGRGRVDCVGGGQFDGLVVAPPPAYGLDLEVRRDRRVIVWERMSRRFVALPLFPEET